MEFNISTSYKLDFQIIYVIETINAKSIFSRGNWRRISMYLLGVIIFH